MTTETVDLVDGREMSWESYVALGEEPRAEYIDGLLALSPSPNRVHQTVCANLLILLRAALPDDLKVTLAWSWKVGDAEFIPDVMVHPQTEESVRFTGIPTLAIEVLSSNRGTDLVVKSFRYADAGLPHYWVLDPRDATLDAYVLENGGYRRAAHVESTPADVSFGRGSILVDLDALLHD